MKLSLFRFDLPKDLIAQYPSPYRDESRLMVLHKKDKTIEHRQFKDLIEYFDDGDLMILNSSKVFPARIHGNKEKTRANIEVFLLRELNVENRLWDVLVDPARKIRIGNKLFFGDDDSLVAEVIDNTTSRGRTLRFLYDGSYEEFRKKLKDLGEMPLPKYIDRKVDEADKERFQTIYAKEEGSISAPTAGLHFSKSLMKRLEIKGINFTELISHIGLGIFNLVEVEDLSKHKMDSEKIRISDENCNDVNHAIRNKNRVCSIGINVMRAIESSVSSKGLLNPYDGWTSKNIFPPYDFTIANAMITNFHLPKSILMIQVAAFAGRKFLIKAYKEAIKEKYKFLAYGDAMLII